jgi:hypothetical protein
MLDNFDVGELCLFIEGKGRVDECSSAWGGGGERFRICGSTIWGQKLDHSSHLHHQMSHDHPRYAHPFLAPPFLATLPTAPVSNILFNFELGLEMGGIQDFGHFFFSPLPLP